MSLWQDIRYGVRTLAKEPGFTATAVITLALGIGANTAIFSLGNVFMFRPMPVKNADRLAVVALQRGPHGEPGQMPYLDYLDYRQNSSFSEMTAYVLDLAGLGYEGHADRIIMSYVPSNFFSMLGINTSIGRLIRPGEGDARNTGQVVVLGNAYWKRRFAGDPRIIGRSVSLDGQAMTIIGVVPEQFHGAYNIVEMDAYVPLGMYGAASGNSSFFTSREDTNVRVLGTLKPGVSVRQAEAELGVIARRLAREYPQTEKDRVVRVFAERMARPEPSVADSMPLVATVFLVLVGLVLLVACINVANLLLARSAARQREMSIRAAIGAGRGRLIRQLLTESVLLAVMGAVGGALAGNWVCHLLDRLRPLGDFPIHLAATFDWRVFSYVAAVAMASGILAGLAPALRASKADLNEALREGGRGLIGDSGGHMLRNGLVIGQVAGSLIVLVAAGLFTRSLTHAESIDLGFDPHNVLNVSLDPGLQGYQQARAETFFRELLRRAKTLPGVESASIAFSIPLSYYNDGAKVYAEGRVVSSDLVPGAGINIVSPDYFTTMRTPIVAGRVFNDADTATSQAVAIINRTMAQRLWPGENPLGRRFSYKGPNGTMVAVVGVAKDTKVSGLLDPPGPHFYLPQTQSYRSTHVLQLKTSVTPESLVPAVEAMVRDLDPNLPLYDVMSMDRSLQGANGFFLFQVGAAIGGALGGLGLLLAVVGVYGVVSYTASRRRHEIGIRMALGAQPGRIFGLVARQGALLVGGGICVGLLAALAVTQLLVSLLVGVAPYDPLTYASVAGVLLTAALVACYIPAHRAVRVDPMQALRHE
jgi:macrolide transport system ATP-binding/permease protein